MWCVLLSCCFVRTSISSIRKNTQLTIAHAVLFIGAAFAIGCSGGGGNGDPTSTLNPSNPLPETTQPPDPQPLVLKSLAVAPENISSKVESNAMHSTPVMAFNSDGAGVAVWGIYSGNGGRVVYSIFNPGTKVWSPELTIAISERSELDIAAISNGQSFLVAWSDGYDLYARTFSPGGSQPWSDSTLLNDLGKSIYTGQDHIGLATDGNSYLVVWRGPDVYARLYSAGKWSAQQVLGPTDRSAGYIQILGLVDHLVSGGATGYVAAWVEVGDGISVSRDSTRIRANVYNNTTANWAGAFSVATENTYIDRLDIASNKIGHALYWQLRPENTSTMWSAIARVSAYDTRASTVLWSAPTTLSTSFLGSESNISLAASATDFAAVWAEQTDASAPVELRSSQYVAGTDSLATWTTPESIVTVKYSQYSYGDLKIVGGQSGFACAWNSGGWVVRALHSNGVWSVENSLQLKPDQNISAFKLASRENEYALVYGVFTYSSFANRLEETFASESSGLIWSSPMTVFPLQHLPSIRSSSRAEPAAYGSAVGFWYAAARRAADSTDKISGTIIHRPGAEAGMVERLSTGKYRGSADMPHIASNSSGDLLVAWPQFDDGLTVLYAATRHAGTWSEPIRLSIPNPDPYNSYVGVNDRSIHVASNNNSFAVMWSDEFGASIRLFDGSKPVPDQWDSAPRRVNGYEVGASNQGTALTAYKTGYGLSWIQYSSSPFGQTRSVELATLVDGVWQQLNVDPPILTGGYTADLSALAVGNENSLLIAWQATADTGAVSMATRIFKDDKWSTKSTIFTATPTSVERLVVEADASGGFAMYWINRLDQLYGTLLLKDSPAWAPPQQLAKYTLEFASTSGALGHTAAWFSSSTLEAVNAQADKWRFLTPRLHDWRIGYNRSETQTHLIEVEGSLFHAWTAYDFNNHGIGVGRLTDGIWTDVFAVGDLGGGTVQRRDPSIAKFGNGAAMAWVQYDRDVDASDAEIVVQPDLF